MVESLSFWNTPEAGLLARVGTSLQGLSEEEALRRGKESAKIKAVSPLRRDLLLLMKQFRSPLVLILIAAVILSSVLAEYTNTVIILFIILLTGFFGFWHERKAVLATQELLALVQTTSTVTRGGRVREVPLNDVVPGDIISLNAGDIIPGDCRLLEVNDLHVNEAPLTGESFPQEKRVTDLPAETPLNRRVNCVFHGTNVINGSATAVVVLTGTATGFGRIAEQTAKQAPETAFEKGLKKFGYLLMQVTLLIALVITALNVYLGRPPVDSFLFGLSLALGMTPELLPAIVTITLSAGAKRMAAKKVIVKKLSAIQNFGAADVLCADKTGTLTEGTVKVRSTTDLSGRESEKVKIYAYLNASFETGFTNPLDEAIRDIAGMDISQYTKFDEVPYDFVRKRLSVVVATGDRHIMITKGAVRNVLDVCSHGEGNEGPDDLGKFRTDILRLHGEYSAAGYRTIGICWKDVTDDPVINKGDEVNMVFLGFIVLEDPPRRGVEASLKQLRDAGVAVKVITGDNELVARHLTGEVGLHSAAVLTGSALNGMSDEALVLRAGEVDVFAETEPFQKERIVRALRKGGHVVAYIGDGINDVSAMKAADVSLSVEGAVDVAKDTADLVLLEKNLEILKDGIFEGRKTFANTMKYIYITTSANFGNMFSMAVASVILPFLPLLPKQILLANFLSDFPAMALPGDRVDNVNMLRPAKWSTRSVRNFMIVFGSESSLFDILTFVVLIQFFHAGSDLFRTSWFVESTVTEILILLTIRTQQPVLRSRPGKFLLLSSALIIAVACILPYTPLSDSLGFSPMPAPVALAMGAITLLYCVSAELTKKYFFKPLRIHG